MAGAIVFMLGLALAFIVIGSSQGGGNRSTSSKPERKKRSPSPPPQGDTTGTGLSGLPTDLQISILQSRIEMNKRLAGAKKVSSGPPWPSWVTKQKRGDID